MAALFAKSMYFSGERHIGDKMSANHRKKTACYQVVTRLSVLKQPYTLRLQPCLQPCLQPYNHHVGGTGFLLPTLH